MTVTVDLNSPDDRPSRVQPSDRPPLPEGFVPETMPAPVGDASLRDDLADALRIDAARFAERITFPDGIVRSPENAAVFGQAMVALVDGLLVDAELPEAVLWVHPTSIAASDAQLSLLASPRSALGRRGGIRVTPGSGSVLCEVPASVVDDAVAVRTDLPVKDVRPIVARFFDMLRNGELHGFTAGWSVSREADGRVALRLLPGDLGMPEFTP